MRERKWIEPGESGRAEMPHSEVCMHMQVAGKVMRFTLLAAKRPCVQLWRDDGSPFSFPILPGEAGIFEEGDAIYYYPALDVATRVA